MCPDGVEQGPLHRGEESHPRRVSISCRRTAQAQAGRSRVFGGSRGDSALTRAEAVSVCPLASWVLSAELAELHHVLPGPLAFGLHLTCPCP